MEQPPGGALQGLPWGIITLQAIPKASVRPGEQPAWHLVTEVCVGKLPPTGYSGFGFYTETFLISFTGIGFQRIEKYMELCGHVVVT